MAIKHAFTSSRSDSDDAGAIQPSHFNADHVVEGLLGALLNLAASPNTVPYVDGAGAGSSFLVSAFMRSIMNTASLGALVTALGVAPLNSPAFSGFPTTPTPAPHDNSGRVANTEYVDAAVSALINGSPGALDTLNELAAAMGNDPNFSATMVNALALKAPLASPSLTGSPTAPTVAGSTDSTAKIATTAFVQACILALAAVARTGAYADLTGKPTLGTAAALNVGAGANNIVQLDGAAKLPAVDASQLTKLSLSSGSVALTGANVALGAINTITDVLTTGALGTGTFSIRARVSLKDTSAAASFVARLYDGTTVLGSSGYVYTTGAGGRVQAFVEAIVTNPAGPVRLQAFDSGTANGLATYNDSGHPPETYMSWIKIAG